MIDLIIIVLVILGALVGAKRGFTKELVSVLGFIACIVLAFIFKNTIASFFYDKLPFFSFGGFIKGITALNILIYEVLAFLIAFTLFKILLKIIKIFTGIFESFLTATIILGIPSKILGAILGALEWLVISFIILFVLSLPIFGSKIIYKSKIYDLMLTITPKFSKQIDNVTNVINEFEDLKNKYVNSTDTNQFNLDSLDLMLKYHIIDVESANKLYLKGKFKTINNIESVLDKYKPVSES